MTLEEMRARKRELGLTSEMVAQLSGVPLGTVQKIFGGATKAPRRKTIEALEKVLRYDPDEILKNVPDHAGEGALRESAAASQTGREERLMTLDDYYALPDDQRVELIDGKFYNMPAPSLLHQEILGELYIHFKECVRKHGKACKVYLSPCDVRLDKDNYTMVQPDLLVLCGEYDYRHAIRYEGAPALVVEILSPSTRTKDMLLKLYKYQNAGVREYWIIDPKYRKVTVHCFTEEDYFPHQYDFTEEIPVGISGGECRIDFSVIAEETGLK